MVDLSEFFTRAQIGFALMVIAFVFVWRFFVKFKVPIEYSERRPTET